MKIIRSKLSFLLLHRRMIGILLIVVLFSVFSLTESSIDVKDSIGQIQYDGNIAVPAVIGNETHTNFAMSAVINDDYCDNIYTGEDETNTSACSFFTSRQTFVCTKDGMTPIQLPMSRIHDGICDCCDGRDEINTPFPLTCSNTCEQSLATLRKQALITYRNIQAGRRKKTELLQKWKQRKVQEVKNYQDLLTELKSLTTLITRMKFLLHYELEREDLLRWQLIREREHHCAAGFPDSCDFFHSDFVNEDELMYEGYPLAFAPVQKKRRFVWEYTKEELEYLQRVKGLLKVKAMLCPRKHLLPDDNARIFTKLSDYLDFMESPYGYAQLVEKNKVNPKKLQERSYFAQFLEKGERGYIMAAVVWWELVGLLLSPVTLPLQLVYYGYDQSKQWLWQRFEKWESDYHEYLLQYYLEEYHDTLSSNNDEDKENEDRRKVTKTTSLSFKLHYSLKRLIGLVLDTQREGTMMFQFLDYFDLERYPALDYLRGRYYQLMSLPYWIYSIVMNAPLVYYQVYLTASQYEALPPRRNACLLREGISTAESELTKLQEEIHHYEEMKAILIQQKVDALVEKEATQHQKNNNKNNKKSKKTKRSTNNFISSFFGEVYDRFFTASPTRPREVKIVKPNKPSTSLFSLPGLVSSFWSNSPSTSSTTSTSLTTTTTGNPYYDKLQKLYLDYGDQNEWESLDAFCLPSHSLQGYNYSFCFFQEIYQEGRESYSTRYSLGKFSHWGYDLLDYHHQQYPVFYSLLQKYIALASDLNRKDFKLQHLANIYDIQDAILQRHDYQPSSQYSLYNYFFHNNTLYQSLTQQFSPEERETVTRFFQQFYLFGSSSNNNTSSMTGMTSQGMQSHQKLKTAMLALYERFFPRLNSNSSPRIYTSPTDEKEELLQEQLHLYYSQQVYEDGTDCQTKPGTARKTIVYFDCGAEHSITEVKELEVCHYEMRVVTPLVCNEFLEKKALRQLEALGVFGFTKKN